MRIITLVTSYIFFSCLFFSSAEENSKPAWLGIVTSKVDPIVATQLDLPEGTGAAIKLIVRTACRKGAKKHDIIFELMEPKLNHLNLVNLLVPIKLMKVSNWLLFKKVKRKPTANLKNAQILKMSKKMTINHLETKLILETLRN